jgi:hypothetical protein
MLTLQGQLEEAARVLSCHSELRYYLGLAGGSEREAVEELLRVYTSHPLLINPLDAKNVLDEQLLSKTGTAYSRCSIVS